MHNAYKIENILSTVRANTQSRYGYLDLDWEEMEYWFSIDIRDGKYQLHFDRYDYTIPGRVSLFIKVDIRREFWEAGLIG